MLCIEIDVFQRIISLRQVDMRSYANKRSVHACRTIYLLGPPGTYTPRIRSYPGDHARMPYGWVRCRDSF